MPRVKAVLKTALRDLADHLREINKDQWLYLAITIPEKHTLRKDLKLALCGTVGCALGHTKDVPSCMKLKTHRVWPYVDSYDFQRAGLPKDVAFAIFYGGPPMYKGGWDATKEQVADRIDHWLETGEILEC